MGKSKPRVLALYTELTSLQKGHDECITDYVLRVACEQAPSEVGKKIQATES